MAKLVALSKMLRIACIWESEPGKPPVTPAALAPGSYHVAGQKTKDGQEDLPKPIGKVWLANGIYPGWQKMKPKLEDPRSNAPSAEEVGKGPLTPETGRFLSVEKTNTGIELVYEVFDVKVREKWLTLSGMSWPAIVRRITVGPGDSDIFNLLSYDGGEQERRINSMTPEQLQDYKDRMGRSDEAGIWNRSLSWRSGGDAEPRV